jgi:hypothetical protein
LKAATIRFGISRFQALPDRRELRRRLRDRDAGLQECEPFDPARAAVLELVAASIERSFHRRRDPVLKLVADERPEEASRHDADDRVGNAVQSLGLADDLGVAAIPVLPCLVADHGDRMSVVSDVLIGLERAAEDRANAESLEVVGRHDASRRALRAVADRQRRASDVLRDEGIKERAFSPQVLEVEPGDVIAVVVVDAGQSDHPLLMSDEWEGAQKDALDPAENRGCRADSDRQAKNREDQKGASEAPGRRGPDPAFEPHAAPEWVISLTLR